MTFSGRSAAVRFSGHLEDALPQARWFELHLQYETVYQSSRIRLPKLPIHLTGPKLISSAYLTSIIAFENNIERFRF